MLATTKIIKRIVASYDLNAKILNYRKRVMFVYIENFNNLEQQLKCELQLRFDNVCRETMFIDGFVYILAKDMKNYN